MALLRLSNQVENIRIRSRGFIEPHHFSSRHCFRYLRIGVIEISPIASASRTKLHASRLLTSGDEVFAEGTLLHRSRLVNWSVEFTDNRLHVKFGAILDKSAYPLVGAGLHAGLAPNAKLGINRDNPRFLIFRSRSCWTNIHTRRVVTVLALERRVGQLTVGKFSHRTVSRRSVIRYHPAVPDIPGQIIRHFACHRASIAAKASFRINSHSVAHGSTSSPMKQPQ